MNKGAIEHIPMSQYAYGIDENHVAIRLRTARADVKKCVLYYGDRASRNTPVPFTAANMNIAASTDLFDYYEVVLENVYKRLCYYFEISDDDTTLLYYGDLFNDSCVDDRSEYFQFPYNHRADIVTPPDWVKDTIIYNIFPDSFAAGYKYISEKPAENSFNGVSTKGKLGGTISGITANIPYLEELGVNAIYINPIFTAGEYHKYDLIDYYHIDSCFGTDEDFRTLVEECHKAGIKVIIDGVFNHCGWKFFAFEDVVQNGEKSQYKDWFYRLEFPVVRPQNPDDYPNYECFGYERLMPKLNTMNPEVQKYFCDVCRYWLEEYNIDGWRLDVASEVNDGFWRAFYKTAKTVNPQAVLIGEVWETANHWLDGTIFDSAMNYDFRKHCKRFFADESIDALEFDSRVTNMRMRYRKQTVYAQLNLLDSHDVTRFLSLCDGDIERYTLAVLFQMTFCGMPSVFYGDEQGLMGMEEEVYRQSMKWNASEELFEFFKSVIRLRKEFEVLRSGDYRTLQAEKNSRLYIYQRYSDNDDIRIAINMEKHDVKIDDINGKVLLSRGYNDGMLKSMGYVIIQK